MKHHTLALLDCLSVRKKTKQNHHDTKCTACGGIMAVKLLKYLGREACEWIEA